LFEGVAGDERRGPVQPPSYRSLALQTGAFADKKKKDRLGNVLGYGVIGNLALRAGVDHPGMSFHDRSKAFLAMLVEIQSQKLAVAHFIHPITMDAALYFPTTFLNCRSVSERMVEVDSEHRALHQLVLAELAWDRGDVAASVELRRQTFPAIGFDCDIIWALPGPWRDT
jgi:hypothetical protein